MNGKLLLNGLVIPKNVRQHTICVPLELTKKAEDKAGATSKGNEEVAALAASALYKHLRNEMLRTDIYGMEKWNIMWSTQFKPYLIVNLVFNRW